MDGVHDLGGMDGFGPLAPADDGAAFHEEWEGLTYAAFVAGFGAGAFNIDQFRHAVERMSPADYLAASYYERWLRAVTRLLVADGVLDPADLVERTEAFAAGDATVPERRDPDLLGNLAAGVAAGYHADEGGTPEPRFAVGDRVEVRNHNPAGHTRCPGYVRRATGEVRAYRGGHAYPDAAAAGESRVEPLYNVAFDAEELWGDRATAGHAGVAVDLWEPYLRPAER